MNQTNPGMDMTIIFKTHALSIVLILLGALLISKFILPQILLFFEKRANMEVTILQEGITKLIEGQTRMNEALIGSLEEIKKRVSTTHKIIVMMILVFFLSSCDSDTITVYKTKPIIQQNSSQLQVKKPAEISSPIIPVKECEPKCDRLEYCTESGHCRAVASSPNKSFDMKDAHSAIYLVNVDKIGHFSNGDEMLMRNR